MTGEEGVGSRLNQGDQVLWQESFQEWYDLSGFCGQVNLRSRYGGLKVEDIFPARRL
jgi:hypothetical protein